MPSHSSWSDALIFDNKVTYREKFIEICHSIFADGIKKHEEKEKDLADFYSCVANAQQETRSKSIAKVDEFLDYKAMVRMQSSGWN